MSVFSITLPSDGTNADVSDYNDPLTQIVSGLNGGLDDNNISGLSGTKITANTLPATAQNAAARQGWIDLGSTLSVASGYNKGNKEFDITSSADLTTVLSPGMRLKVTRGTTPPTQSTALNGTSQYWSRATPTGLSFTTTFTTGGWVYLTSYAGGGIIARRNLDTEGWSLGVNASGQVVVSALRIAVNNKSGTSRQSVPLNKWTHIATSMDVSVAGDASTVIYINGAVVPSSVNTTGTCTALVQGVTALVIGAEKSAGTNPFPGFIAQTFVYSAVLTATQIQDRQYQELTGSETNLAGYHKFNGDGNDSHANANNLTAVSSAVATNLSNPFNATEMLKITKITAGVITVFGGEDNQVPNMTLTNPFYSTQDTPFGFNNARGKWKVETYSIANFTNIGFGAVNVWQSGLLNLAVPTGLWNLGYQGSVRFDSTVSGTRSGFVTLSSSVPTAAVYSQELTSRNATHSSPFLLSNWVKNAPVTTTAQTTYTLYGAIDSATGTETFRPNGNEGSFIITAELAY